MNWIYRIERVMTEWLECGTEPDSQTVRELGEALGQPTKKHEALMARYGDVFRKLIQKNCARVGDQEVCIYSWNPRAYIRYFPAALHATGTIVAFRPGCKVELLAYPVHRSYDPEVRGVRLPEGEVPVEVSKRADGWQVTAYYDPILKRWMFATRFVLHNMYYERGRLVVRDYGEIVNPYVEVADALASELGLYDRLKGFEGWTFTFTLVGPEPAITKPPPPILLGDYTKEYRLLLVAARKPDGTLLTVRESGELLRWDTVEIVETGKKLGELAEEAARAVDVRSYMARLGDDPETPPVYELKSRYYQDAMRFKHMYDAKSYAMLCLEGVADRALSLVEDEEVRREAGRLGRLIRELSEYLEEAVPAKHDEMEEYFKQDKLLRSLIGELRKAKSSGSAKRLAKKFVALLLEGKSVLECTELLEKKLNELKSIFRV